MPEAQVINHDTFGSDIVNRVAILDKDEKDQRGECPVPTNEVTVTVKAKKEKQKSNFLVAPISGIIEVTSSHPIDRVKTKIQELNLNRQKSDVFSAVKDIYRSNGLTGFYSGYVARVLGIMPMRLVYWESMRQMNHMVEGSHGWFNQLVVPGAVVGVIQTSIDNPIEVLKIRQMTGDKSVNFSQVMKGFTPCVIRNVIFSIFVSGAVKLFGDDYPFLAGAVGGFVGSVASQPFDVVKTEMQRVNGNQSGLGMTAIFSQIISKSPRDLFSGTLMRGVMSFVNMGVGYLAFNRIYRLVSRYQSPKPNTD